MDYTLVGCYDKEAVREFFLYKAVECIVSM